MSGYANQKDFDAISDHWSYVLFMFVYVTTSQLVSLPLKIKIDWSREKHQNWQDHDGKTRKSQHILIWPLFQFQF